MTFREQWESLLRSCRHHALTHMMTVTVLSGTFTLIAVILLASVNIRTVLMKWGDDIQMTVFLNDSSDDASTGQLRSKIEGLGKFKSVEYITKTQAREEFSKRVSAYAPELVADPDFQTAFPASFQLKLKSSDLIGGMKALSEQILTFGNVSDVSYGQDWIQNYSQFSKALTRFGIVIALILFAASLFIIGNALRISIAQRTEEIEILELIGATARRIRAPFIFEGIVLGATSALVACVCSFVLYKVQSSILTNELPFLDLAQGYTFFSIPTLGIFIFSGACIGYLGSRICLRSLTDGWFASRRKTLRQNEGYR